jgi:tetratricopeptide (TPR) repeat protein
VRSLLFALALLLASASVEAHEGLKAEIQALDARIAASPGDAELLVERARLRRLDSDPAGSLVDLTRAGVIAPTLRGLILERALTEIALGQSAAAEADLSRFLGAGAPSVAALTARAAIREADRRFALARADYDAAVKLRADPDLYLARGRVDEALGQLDRAALGYEEGLRALSGAVVMRLALIRVEHARRRFDHAIHWIDEAMSTSPLQADWLLLRADEHASAGRSAAASADRLKALAELDTTLARRPSDHARLLRARALVALGRDESAVRDLEAIVARSPGDTEAQTLLTAVRSRLTPARP